MIVVDFNKKWWLPILFLSPIITGFSYLLVVLISGDSWSTGFTWSLLPNIVIMFFLGGPLGEELGWRGYALEKIQKKENALVSSLIIGFVWGLWHLPLHFITGTTQEYIPIWAFILLQMILSIIYTWIYNNTHSVLAVMLFHWIGNASAMLLPFWQKGFIGGEPSLPNYWVPSIGMLVVFFLNVLVALIIIYIWKPEKLKKENIPK